MAITNDGLRKLIKTSVHGRRLGLDQTEHLVGPKGLRYAITAATSASTGTQLPNHGHITITSSSAKTWQIADPVPGCEVSITLISSAIPTCTITPANATFVSSGSSTGASLAMQGGGTSVTLVGISTGVYANKGASPASTYIDFST